MTRGSSSDEGAALVVAVAFVVMISAIVAGLTAMVTSGLQQREILEDVRDREYAADGAVEAAIVATRQAVEAGALACDASAASASTVNGVDIRVDRLVLCGALVGSDGLPVTRMSVVFAACVDDGAPCGDDAVIVRALVGFELDGSGGVADVPVHSWSVRR